MGPGFGGSIWFPIVVAFVAGVIVGAVMMMTGEGILEREAVKRGFALHCPSTGEWAWKGECSE